MNLKYECCELCGCFFSQKDTYASDNKDGRSHQTKHHLVAQRFYGKNKKREPILIDTDFEDKTVYLCYDCHEELLHNPVLTKENINKFRELIIKNNCDEKDRNDKIDKSKIRKRIILFNQIITKGIEELNKQIS